MARVPSAGPFFLEDLAHQKLVSWARGHPSPAAADHKLLVLTGPIKSGKSALLNDVLPGVLATQHAACGGPTPVFFRFSFTLGEGSQAAALTLARAVSATASALGFEILAMPTTGEQALCDMARIVRDLAAGVAAGGGELVVLIDEAQVRRRPAVLPAAPLALVAPCPFLTAVLVAHYPALVGPRRRPSSPPTCLTTRACWPPSSRT